MFKACIFDMDGVIVDSTKYHYIAWKRLADELAIDFKEDDYENHKGLSRVDSLDLLLLKGNMELDNDTKIALMDKKNAWYLKLIEDIQQTECLPGVRDLITELTDNGIPCGVGSSSRNAQRILTALGLYDLFSTIVDGNRLTFSKPDPEVFLKGASEMGVNPTDTIVFEDAVVGVQAANKGGFFSIGIGDSNRLRQANHVIPGFEGFDLEQLKSVFQKS